MRCSKCGMEYGSVNNFCNNCGNKLKNKVKIKYFNGAKKFKDLLFNEIPGFNIYLILLTSTIFFYFMGWLTGLVSGNSLFLSRLSFFLYLPGSVSLILLIMLRFIVAYKLSFKNITEKSINPVVNLVLLMLPVIGLFWHFNVYFRFALKKLDKHNPLLFFIYSSLNILIFIPGLSIVFIVPYLMLDVYVHKTIYDYLAW